MSDKDDQEAARRKEINMFSAMALGSGDDGSEGDSASASNLFDSGPLVLPSSKNDRAKDRLPPPVQDDDFCSYAAADPPPRSLQDMFSAAANADIDSGTFAISTSSNKTEDHEADEGRKVNNLDAALAAFRFLDDDDGDGMVKKSARPPNPATEKAKVKRMTEDYPMYAEEVRMPRPLFFGPIIPPRVLNETRNILKIALADQGYTDAEVNEFFNHSNNKEATMENGAKKAPPKLSLMPLEVRNLVGALRTHGFGISAFPTDGQQTTHKSDGKSSGQDDSFWVGSPYVSTFQPVFGDAARAFRLDNGNGNNKNAQIVEEGEDNLASTDHVLHASPEARTVKAVSKKYRRPGTASTATEVTASTTTSVATAAEATNNDADEPHNSPRLSEQALFSMWARGESCGSNDDDNNSLGNHSNHSGGSFGKQSSEISDVTMSTTRSKLAPGGAPSTPTNDSAGEDGKKLGLPRPMSDQDLFSQWVRGESPSSNSISHVNTPGTFAAEAHSSFSTPEPADTKKADVDPGATFQKVPFHDGGTFQRIPNNRISNCNGDDSDDDSIVGSELKKKVGINEHLDAALASLVDDGPLALEQGEGEDSHGLLPAVRSTPGGRPLSNLELTSGCAPLYGIDDSPLPVEGDLGIHETKDDQQRTVEQNRSQDIIEKYVGPNVFGPVACPNPAISPDDNHSWNSRAAPSQRYNIAGGGGLANGSGPGQDRLAVLPVPGDVHSPRPPAIPRKNTRNPPKPTNSISSRTRPGASGASTASTPTLRKSKSNVGQNSKRAGRYSARSRYGWWSLPDESDAGGKGSSRRRLSDGSESINTNTSPTPGPTTLLPGSEPSPFQLPPLYHSSHALHIDTRLEPEPEKLREENQPLSSLHGATSMAQGLPYLSDRPPSYRYLQIDTQAVGFPPLGGEVEPLFCSLAIYHVETTSVSPNDANAAPVPDLQRCGRVTEVLNFDVVSDQQVEDLCVGSLWPFFLTSTMTPIGSRPETHNPKDVTSRTLSKEQCLQGTRCGVFPLPSNLNVANLYAVLIVQKVLSEDTDFEIYLKQSKNRPPVDLNKFRAKAEKASNQHGSFLMPFAFGVAPLLQVFGADNPIVASSRAVQIPLFRFSAGQGERQIIDHIMVMLYPRADFRSKGIGGPAAVTNGGTAMLVMRNFGYLGLHAVVNSRSSLARDRLVDFTGELQIRRKSETDSPESTASIKEENTYVVPDWHPQFVSEPTINGGRNLVDLLGDTSTKLESAGEDLSSSPLYAQELSPVPLSPSSRSAIPTPATAGSPRGRMPPNRGDIEPYYHASFCNELLCHPRLLHNCPKGNIVIKVELREMEWKQEHNAFVAHLPRNGPSIHNARRGPFLIHGTFTSCSVRSSDPHFLDEVKVKLPLELKPRRRDSITRTLSLFFTAFHVKFSSRKKWSKVLTKRGAKPRDLGVSNVNDVNEATGERIATPTEDQESASRCKLVHIASGFLPITTHTCLIENGMHDVKMMYKARPPPREIFESGLIEANALIVTELGEYAGHTLRDSQASSGFDTREDDTTIASGSRTHSEAEIFGSSHPDDTDSSFSDAMMGVDERLRSDLLSADPHGLKTTQDQMTLQVGIVVHSSVHSQNATLSEFLQSETDQPAAINPADNNVMTFLKASRSELVERLVSDLVDGPRWTQPEEEKMINSVIGIARAQVCPTSEVSKHFLRVIVKLWKTLVCGTGEVDLLWSNPAAMIPLRVHAFASLLQVLGSVALYMSKHGVTQLDGLSKWDVVSLGRVVAMLFDEDNLFGYNKEITDSDLFLKTESKAKPRDTVPNKARQKKEEKPKRKRHVRNTFEFNHLTNAHSFDASGLSSSFGDLVRGLSGLSPGSDFKQRSQTIAAPPTQKASPTSWTGPMQIDTSPTKATASKAHKPDGLREIKVDSVSDFRNNLELGLQNESTFDSPLTSTNVDSLMQKFGGLSVAGKKRWMTAPAPALATISENDEGDEGDGVGASELSPMNQQDPITEPKDALDSELVLHGKKSSVKQMRVPKRSGRTPPNSNNDDVLPDITQMTISSLSGIPADLTSSSPTPNTPSRNKVEPALPQNEDDIAMAGFDFLAKSFGVSHTDTKTAREEKGVGNAPHRRTRSRCSIDWTLTGDDSTEDLTSSNTDKNISGFDEESDDHDESMSTILLEEQNCIRLPNYVDRLMTLGKSSDDNGRWYPYAYEVIIMVWVAFLVQQRASPGDQPSMAANSSAGSTGASRTNSGGASKGVDASLSEAAMNSHRVAISSAPLLFEVLKASLGRRVKNLARELPSRPNAPKTPPLVVLDDTLQANLEQLISMITDACTDSRNFDSRDVRQMSIDVNDAIVRFLRDLFGFMKPSSVYRLILVYFSRFVTKDGKQRQDRDSSIGLRCSWEITKLRLNAATALIRFPDFLRVCSPQMNNWTRWWSNNLGQLSDIFFDDTLEHFRRLDFSTFVTDGSSPSFECMSHMRPHWLAEIVTDICLSGTEHAEQYIQQRAASLLHELFWANSQQSTANGTSPVVASMYATFLEKVLLRSSYLSNFSPKSQLRKDILPCVLFILQCAPNGLLRAQWRKLCAGTQGKGTSGRYGGTGVAMFAGSDAAPLEEAQSKNEPDVLDMFTLLNMALSTIEYEGCEELLEGHYAGGENDDQLVIWHKEFLLVKKPENHSFLARRQALRGPSRGLNSQNCEEGSGYATSDSRKWYSHDGSIVIINCAHQIVSELYVLLESSPEGQKLLNPARRRSIMSVNPTSVPESSRFAAEVKLSRADIVIFVRAATSLYLHSLALRQSDIVLIRTFKVSVELVKIFGIKVFLEAVGETLQHWMRVVSIHCGARRANVRIEATDFLELVLRSTWDSYGSFFRIRLPLLAVQTEVMERIVATAATRYYREERRQGSTFDNFSNASAEAALSPLWRTLDRLHHQPASQNVAFRGALIRLAVKLKKLYRAYIAARALSYLNSVRSPKFAEEPATSKRQSDSDALVHIYRLCVIRVINASAGYSKQFLGFDGTSLSSSNVAHFEAVEDAFIDAADVFSPTELPEHRVAWLRMLADFHASRRKFAEEASCHFQIHITLKQAAGLHSSLWSNTPFLPWTSSMSDPVHIDGDNNPSSNAIDYSSDFDFDDAPEGPNGKHIDDANSSRRIFYRVANSVRANTEDWETGLSKTLFCGVTFAVEYGSVSPWISLREMEEKMVEEAEMSGDLFLQAGIIESSRYAWNLATQFYSEKFNYGKLAQVYGCLTRTVVSQVPPIDASQHQEVSISVGRFYRVYFHGGAPDELIGAEFVYRTASTVRLEQFGESLREIIKCILPRNTPIHLALDGRAEESAQRGYGGFSRLGPAPLEPVTIKVTPLRPIFGKAQNVRGLPEWFHRYIDEISMQSTKHHTTKPTRQQRQMDAIGRPRGPTHREHNRSFGSSASVFVSGGSSGASALFSRRNLSKGIESSRPGNAFASGADNDLVGVDKFSFLQAVHHKDRLRGTKDWWKPSSGDFAQKTLKVTQLQVAQSFPACVTRQAVVHRMVFTQSPLEAGVDWVCQWCSVLFRTAVATNGQAILGVNADPGIGTDAAKVVADCVHSSRVKEMGLSLLKKNGSVAEQETASDIFQNSDRLMEDEVNKLQGKLARVIVVFMELLHLLIARNRDLLLNVIQERRKDPAPSVPSKPQAAPIGRSQSTVASSYSANPRGLTRPKSYDANDNKIIRSVSDEAAAIRTSNKSEDHSRLSDEQSSNMASLAGGLVAGNVRTDSAIAVQSELQRAFISLSKTLYPGVSGILVSETPRWLKQCCQENYFSLGTYRQTRIPISEELCFSSAPTESLNIQTGTNKGDTGSYSAYSNPLTAEHLGNNSADRLAGSPSGSNASGSVYSNSDVVRFSSHASSKNDSNNRVDI